MERSPSDEVIRSLRDGPWRIAPTEAGRIKLALLGGFRLTQGHRAVELPCGTQRLVALLALRGRSTRSRLAGILRPDTTEQRALASLRTALWRVKQAVPNLVLCAAATVDLFPSVEVDVQRFTATGVHVMSGAAPPHLIGALAEYDGELLPDWEDSWLLPERERLRQLRLHVLEQVAGELTQQGRFGLALHTALLALRADLSRESAHRAVIRIHLAEGNVSEARRAYETCRRVLLHEVGVEPSPATQTLVTAPATSA